MLKKLGLAMVGASIFIWGFFVQPQITHAENQQSTNVDVKTNKEEWEKTSVLLNKLSQWLYAMSWPMMILAGTFTDNDVIYGTFIWLDKSLWGIWNMMRTFANFFIWFLFIVAVLCYFWDIKKEQLNPMKILPQMVLASVLVNASWFIIGAMLDLSTIATYAVGLLPMKVDDTIKDIAIPKVTIVLAPTNTDSKFQVKLCGDYEACVFDSKWLETSNKPCYFLGQTWADGDTFGYKILEDGAKTQDKWKDIPCSITKEKMLDNMKNLTWPFISIFQSLMDSSQVAKNEASMTPATNASITIMKAIFLIALLVPLVTLCIILVVRAVLLWMIIVFSPLIFLFTAISWFKGILWEKKSLSAVISLIFLPVFVTFALSMSLVFMNALQKSKIQSDIEWPKLLSLFGCKSTDSENMTCTIKEGTDIEMELAQNDKSAGGLLKDLGKWMWRIIANLFGIWFMWVIVFAALKSSKITEGIASSIEKFSTSMAKAAPILPVLWGQSISSLQRWARTIADIPRQRYSQQYQEKLAPIVEETQRDAAWTDRKEAITAKEELEKMDVLEEQDNITDKVNKDVKETNLSTLTPDQKQSMSSSLSEVWISTEAMNSIMKDQAYATKSLGDSGVQEALKTAQNRINLRNFLKESVINKNISLLQAVALAPEMWDTFDSIYKICELNGKTSAILDLSKKGIDNASVSAEFVWLIKDFEKIWITDKEDIFKLLVDDLMSDKVVEKDKKTLEELYSIAQWIEEIE